MHRVVEHLYHGYDWPMTQESCRAGQHNVSDWRWHVRVPAQPGQPRPHAVTSITGTFNGIVNPSFSYDANGNMTARASSSQNVYWFSYNYPSSISGTDPTGS